MKIDISKVENITVADVIPQDYPDFCDAFFESAVWKETGIPLTEDECADLTEQHPEVVNQMAYEHFI